MKESDEVFKELTNPLILIYSKIDILIIEDEIITKNIGLLQSHYKFKEFIKLTARNTISEINNLKIVENIEKLTDYVNRSKSTYARKMMRINKSEVLNHSNKEIYKKITTLPRWKGKFDMDKETRKIKLNSYKDVENLIDLLDERYTRSDITNAEYDTSVKKIAK